jgi:very-short-patch-repair endonuclease
MSRELQKTSVPRTHAAGRGWVDVAELATGQHGVVSLRQLTGLGANASTVRGWVASGLLLRMHHAVYAIGHGSLRPEGYCMAGVLACGPEAKLSHRSAAGRFNVRRPPSTFVELTAPGAVGRSRDGLRVHGNYLRSDEVVELEDGIPCTSLSRTLIDLAAVVPGRALEAAVEAAERLEIFDLRAVSILLARHRGMRGTARLRTVLAAFNAEVLRARSEPEARFFHLCIDHHLPAPLVNRFVDAGDERFEVDCQWPQARLIVEVDSPYHDTTAAQTRDAHRDAALRRHGWTVIRIRWDDMNNPPRLVTRLRDLLADARCI